MVLFLLVTRVLCPGGTLHLPCSKFTKSLALCAEEVVLCFFFSEQVTFNVEMVFVLKQE